MRSRARKCKLGVDVSVKVWDKGSTNKETTDDQRFRTERRTFHRLPRPEVWRRDQGRLQGCHGSGSERTNAIKADKNEVYENGPKVHGARQQSRLDMLDQWEMKACAVFDNANDMMVKAGA